MELVLIGYTVEPVNPLPTNVAYMHHGCILFHKKPIRMYGCLILGANNDSVIPLVTFMYTAMVGKGLINGHPIVEDTKNTFHIVPIDRSGSFNT